MWNFITAGIVSIISNIFGIIKKKIPDATTANIDQTAENIASAAEQANATTEAALNVRADLQGDKMQRDWRAALMYLLIFILANNTVGVTYLHAKEIIMTAQMWNLLVGGAGGFMALQHIENLVKTIKG